MIVSKERTSSSFTDNQAVKISDHGVYSNTSSSSSKKQDSQTTMIISKEKTSSSVIDEHSVKISKKQSSSDGVSELDESNDWIGRSDEMKYNVQRCKNNMEKNSQCRRCSFG